MNHSGTVQLRVTVSDAWDAVTVTASPDTTIADIKAEAVSRVVGAGPSPERYVVKYRCALVVDERSTIGELGPPDGAALILLPGRREPVR